MTLTVLREALSDKYGKRVEVHCDGGTDYCRTNYTIRKSEVGKNKTGYCGPCSSALRPRKVNRGKISISEDPNMLSRLWRLA